MTAHPVLFVRDMVNQQNMRAGRGLNMRHVVDECANVLW